MAAQRFGRVHKAVALVPLALLSAAFTAGVAGVNSPVATAESRPTPRLPDGTSIPTQAIQAPATVSAGGTIAPGLGNAKAAQIIDTAATDGIPSAALAAYQRAETVINAADPSCHLTWQLIAAIGRVESNHGRADGNTLTDAGIATPGIYGPALNGTHSTTEIVDTDAGQFDADTNYDRAVGPMQFIPSTWSVVGVDADGDGVRNPQDINDAALATAVYLCSGNDNLATDAGRRAAVFRYNHSQSYVALVLSIMQAYTEGNFTSMPNSVVAAGQLYPTTHIGHGPGPKHHFHQSHHQQPSSPPSTPSSPTTPPPSTGGSGNTGGSGGSGGSGGNGGNSGGGGVTVGPVSVPPAPTTSVSPVDQALTLAQATAQCIADGVSQLDVAAFQACVTKYMHP